MFCEKCGAKVDEGLRYCPECGNDIKSKEGPGGAVGYDSDPKRTTKERRWVPVGLAALILIAAACITVFVLVAHGVIDVPQTTPRDSDNGSMHPIDKDANSGSDSSSIECIVSFQGGGAKDGNTSSIECKAGEVVKLPACGFSRDGYTFDSWEDENGHHYAPGDPITVSKDTVFSAVWQSSNGFISAFPRKWTGTFGSLDENAVPFMSTMELTITGITELGHVTGICRVGEVNDGVHTKAYAGSYNLEGRIDLSANTIELWGTSWYDQGSLSTMRHFMGSFDTSYREIVGGAETLGGHNGSSWQMTSQ